MHFPHQHQHLHYNNSGVTWVRVGLLRHQQTGNSTLLRFLPSFSALMENSRDHRYYLQNCTFVISGLHVEVMPVLKILFSIILAYYFPAFFANFYRTSRQSNIVARSTASISTMYYDVQRFPFENATCVLGSANYCN